MKSKKLTITAIISGALFLGACGGDKKTMVEEPAPSVVENKPVTQATIDKAEKMYDGINTSATATYNTDGHIEVTIGTVTTILMENENEVVTPLKGWEGKKYTDEDGDYTAIVYSNIEEPIPGDPFNEVYTLTDADSANPGETNISLSELIKIPSITRTSGTERFTLPDNTARVEEVGSYHGVPGTYYCLPTTGCTASVAAEGFTLGGGTWTFKPTQPTTPVSDTLDTIYASYGYWLNTNDDGDYVASTFIADMGDVPDADITTLEGTATYVGGAAGYYSIHSKTGGTNDSGVFTADIELNADFNNDKITGLIDNFIGSNGKSRNWKVTLKESGLVTNGGFGQTEIIMTVWSIGDTSADPSGNWKGSLRNNGEDDVPQVATGTFYTEYGREGRMIGAFGSNVQ